MTVEPRTRNPAWSDDKIDTACRLVRQGMSYGEVADKIGSTRNAVGGTIHRLRLAGDPRVSASSRNTVSNRRRQMDALAELMAEGCPTLGHAAIHMQIEAPAAYDLWTAICQGLGRQAMT